MSVMTLVVADVFASNEHMEGAFTFNLQMRLLVVR